MPREFILKITVPTVRIFVLFLLACAPYFLAFAGDGDRSLPQVNKTFLVNLHITRDSLGVPAADATGIAEVSTAIAGSSVYYESIGLSFEAGEVYYIDNYQFDIIGSEGELTEMSSKYDQPNRINLYLFSGFEDELEGGCGISGSITAPLGAIYMAVGCVNTASFAHESGHFFGLPHTFFPDETQTLELADGTNCLTEGDGICDTPADPYLTESDEVWIEDCVFVYEGKDANGQYFDPDISNIMSYYFEGCACGLRFSDGQLRVVAATYFANQGIW